MRLPDALDRHQDGIVPGRAEPGQSAHDDVVHAVMTMPDLVVACGTARCDAVRWRHRVADPQAHVGADDGSALAVEEPAFAWRNATPACGKRGRCADDRTAAHRIREGDRRRGPHALVAGQGVEDGAVDQGDRLRLQVDRRQDELRVTAGRTDQQVEVVGRLRRRSAQRRLLRADGDPQRHSDGDKQRRCPGDPAKGAQVRDDDGPGFTTKPPVEPSPPASSRWTRSRRQRRHHATPPGRWRRPGRPPRS